MKKEKWNQPKYKRAYQIQKEIGLVDLHLDSIVNQRVFRYNVEIKHTPGVWGQPLFWHADLPRIKETGYGGACMGIHYSPWESEKGWREMVKQINYLDKIADRSPFCRRIRKGEDWSLAKEEGKIGLVPGVEGAHMLNGQMCRVKGLADLGVAYLTLTHFSKNRAATPSLGLGANEKDGLSPFGKELVLELNRYGIAVDLAHVNTPGVLDGCKITKAPPLCTHTGVKGVHPARRNITDEEIHAIASLDGVIGIMFAPHFLCGHLRASSDCIIDHIEYIAKKVGIRHVAIGTDYDGYIPIPADQRDCRDMVKVTHLLLEWGYSEEGVKLILRDNALRVLKAAWELRDKSVRP